MESPRPPWFNLGVGSVAATSMLSDSGHELTTALLPSFLTSILHASASALGVIEGVSDALMGLATLVSGPAANNPRARARLASGGYLGTALATGAIGLTVAVWQVGVLRASAWVSRGLRSPARDTLLSSLTRPDAYGRAFGLERAGDNLGAVVGPLLAAGLVIWIGIRPAMWLAAVPGLFAALTITVAVRKARQRPSPQSAPRRLQFDQLRRAGILRPLLPVVLFEVGNTTTTLLILRATQLLHRGSRTEVAAAAVAILIYAGHNAFGAGVAYAGGHWVDRRGPRVVFAAGAVLYVVAYGMFAVNWGSWLPILIAFCLAGSGIGLAQTAESALVGSLLPEHLRGSGFGLLGGVQAGGDLAASVIVGVLYATVSPTVAFTYAASWMVLAALGSAALCGPGRRAGAAPSRWTTLPGKRV
ncbi:MAG: MFS transporter [Candidatus Dormiibacterota bacterium]